MKHLTIKYSEDHPTGYVTVIDCLEYEFVAGDEIGTLNLSYIQENSRRWIQSLLKDRGTTIFEANDLGKTVNKWDITSEQFPDKVIGTTPDGDQLIVDCIQKYPSGEIMDNEGHLTRWKPGEVDYDYREKPNDESSSFEEQVNYANATYFRLLGNDEFRKRTLENLVIAYNSAHSPEDAADEILDALFSFPDGYPEDAGEMVEVIEYTLKDGAVITIPSIGEITVKQDKMIESKSPFYKMKKSDFDNMGQPDHDFFK